MFLQIRFSIILSEHWTERLFLKGFDVGGGLGVRARVTVGLWAAFRILADLLESLTQFTKAGKLFGREDAADGKFVHKTYLCDLGLGQLNLFQTCLHLGFVDLVGVDSFIERTIGQAETPLGIFHHRSSIHIKPSNLLHLLARQTKLAKSVISHILRLVCGWTLDFLRPGVLSEYAASERERHDRQAGEG